MIFDERERCLELAGKVLRHYRTALGKDSSLRLLQLSENVTYLVEEKAKSRAVLRLCRPGYHTPEELRAEMLWMEELGEEFAVWKVSGAVDVKLRQPVSTDEGSYLCAVEDEEGQVYYGTVFTYLPGIPLEELPAKDQIPWFEKLGEVTAFLHRQTKNQSDRKCSAVEESDRREQLSRFHWNYESMIGRFALWGDWHRVIQCSGACGIEGCGSKLPESFGTVLERADSLIADRLRDYGKGKNRYGLIHGDLRGANLLVDGNTLGIIDFDDCGYGWYMQDLAASLSFMETEEEVPELIQAWCRGYRKQGTLEQADMDMTDTFVMMRRLQLLSWINSRSQAASARRYRDDFLEGTVKLANQYIQIRG